MISLHAALICVRRVGNVHAIDLGRVEQTARVIAQTEDHRALGRRIGALAFEHRRAVVQRMRQHVYGRLFPGHELAVVPDVFRGIDGHGQAPVRSLSTNRARQARSSCNHGMRSRSLTPTFSILCFRSLFMSLLYFLRPRLFSADPLARELALLDFLEDLLHLLLGAVVDDARAAGEVAVLGGVADELCILVRPPSCSRSTISFSSCRHS